MKMKCGIVAIIMALTLLLGMPMTYLSTTVKASPTILTVGTGEEYPTISAAIAVASPGDTILVYSGTYNEAVNIDVPLNITSVSGPALTIIDGTGVTLASAGLVKITAAGDVTFSGFTIENFPLDSNFNEFGIYSSSSTSGVTYTITNNRIVGIGDTNSADFEVGFYSQNDAANVVFEYNTITNTGGNNIVFECHTGTTEISYNTLEAGVGLAADSIFFMTYNGINVAVLQNVSNNTFNMGTGTMFDYDHRSTAISFNTPGAAYGVGDAQFTNVVIQGNTINNLQSYRRGIGFWNGGGSGGGIVAPLVESNTITGITGSTESYGIDFIATGSSPIAASDATVMNNVISNTDYGVYLRTDGCAPGLHIYYNSIASNTVGLDNTVGSSAMNAEYNYWGSPTGPYNAVSNPSGTGNPVNGNVNFQPYLTTPIPLALYLTPTPVNEAPADLGTTFTQTVTLSQFSHFAGFDIKLTWDNSLITLKTVDYTTTLNALWGTGNWSIVYSDTGAGNYELAAVALATFASNPGASAFFTLTFTVAQSSNFPLSTPITFALVKLSDDATPTPNSIPCVTVTDGTYTMSGIVPGLEFKVRCWNGTNFVPVTGSPYRFECSQMFLVDIYVTDVVNLTGYDLTMNFNQTLVAYNGNYGGIFSSNNAVFHYGASSVEVYGSGSAWTGSEGLLVTVAFLVQFAATPDHIWNSAPTHPNNETFPISITAATLTFTTGSISSSGISIPAALTIEIDFIRGDVDCNGAVTLADISDVAYYYGKVAPSQYDLNSDGIIDIYDIVAIATNYGYIAPGCVWG
jgi:hypothetical protein